MGTVLHNIQSVFGLAEEQLEVKKGKELDHIEQLDNAWILIEGDRIADYGSMSAGLPEGHENIDCSGRMVLPTYCDSHTHLVFAAPRDGEFEDRIKGLSYEEIAKRGGGILNSAEKLRSMSEEELFNAAKDRLANMIRLGTGAIEIKSGYGLSMESELKMLRVIRRLKELDWIPIKATFLGAHAIPAEFKNRKDDYINYVCEDILPEVAKEGLADYIDIFCESGYFDVEDTDRVLKKGADYGLKGKIHVNQFNVLGAVKTGTDHGAVSVDHLEYLEEDDIRALQGSSTIATALPSCSFFLGIPYTPIRELINANIPVALASDFNPGSTPSGNMSFVWSLACIKMKMTPVEALNAITINGAAAMELSDGAGSISKGGKANLILTKKIPSLSYIPYSFGERQIHKVMINGAFFE